MIDTWFKQDLQKITGKHPVAVFIDQSGDAAFMLAEVEKNHRVIITGNEIEELKARYAIEKDQEQTKPVLIYTTTPREKLKFVREYCETNGCIEIRHFHQYVKEKVHEHLNLNLYLDKDELLSAAKVSIGRDQTYWMDLCHKGASEIFDMKKELLPFLDDPNGYLKKYDKKLQEMFFTRLNELLGQLYVKKPAATLATETVNHLLNGLAHNCPDKTLLEVYYNWLDSKTYQKSFEGYLKKFKLKLQGDVFSVHPSHPFSKVDESWLSELGSNMHDRVFVSVFLQRITKRLADRAARNLNIDFWQHVKVILEFDEKNISQLSSFDECVSFYTSHFFKLDRAIRNLYTRFLEKKELLRPLQDLYKNHVVLFLDKWFRYFRDYKETQCGKLAEIIERHNEKTAIVVGDGLSFEFASDIKAKVSKEFDFSEEHQYLLAGLPSETGHNMSLLYVDSGAVLSAKKEREQYLAGQFAGKDIVFVDLESVSELTDKAHYLVCYHKDPDKLGEAHQQNSLKYFDQLSDSYARKIEQLLKNGYRNVYLFTDHGFVLTGLLEESDKISVEFTGNVHKHERYIQTELQQQYDKKLLLETEYTYENFNYCYFAKRMGPFKTLGVYGYSHGGCSPQEVIVPCFRWTPEKSEVNTLNVMIANKPDLKDVAGDLFAIKLKAETSAPDLFSAERKIVLLFFAGNEKINESDIITIQKEKEIKKEYQFDKHTSIEVKLLDALTREQLDKATVNKSMARDLGGL